jgi:hypothetical protein
MQIQKEDISNKKIHTYIKKITFEQKIKVLARNNFCIFFSYALLNDYEWITWY